jgi:hypothetical protein
MRSKRLGSSFWKKMVLEWEFDSGNLGIPNANSATVDTFEHPAIEFIDENGGGAGASAD